MPYPSAPLPDTVSASGSCRILRSPCPVWCSGAGAGTPLCDSERTEGGGNPIEEPGEEGEADDPGPKPAKASASVVGGGGGPAAPPSRSAYSPRPRPWQPGEEAAIVSEPAPESCAAQGDPWQGDGARPARSGPGGQSRAGEAPSDPVEANGAGHYPASFPATRARRCLCRERTRGEAAAGEMAERELRWGAPGEPAGAGAGWRPSSVPSWRERATGATAGPDTAKGPVGPRVLRAFPSRRRLVDAQVSCLRGRSGGFRRQGASVQERLQRKEEQENGLDFWRCVGLAGGQQPLTGDSTRCGVTGSRVCRTSRNT